MPTCVLRLSVLFKESGSWQSEYILNAAEILISTRLNELNPEHVENLFLMIQAQFVPNDHYDFTEAIRENLPKY